MQEQVSKFKVGDVVHVLGAGDVEHVVVRVKHGFAWVLWGAHLAPFEDHELELVERAVSISRPCLPSCDCRGQCLCHIGGSPEIAARDVATVSISRPCLPPPAHERGFADYVIPRDTSAAFERGLPKVVLALVAATAVVLALFAVATSCTAQPAPQDPTPPTWDGGTQ